MSLNTKPYEKMQKTTNGHYHKGVYLAGDLVWDEVLAKIENPAWSVHNEADNWPGDLYYNAEIFMKGSCNLFSLALSKEFGLTAYELKDNGNSEGSVHCFCVSSYKGEQAFVDVRGVTTDFDEFCRGLNLRPEWISVLQDTSIAYSELSNSEMFGYDFALWVIANYPKLYTAD